jgi:hypothetical protein
MAMRRREKWRLRGRRDGASCKVRQVRGEDLESRLAVMSLRAKYRTKCRQEDIRGYGSKEHRTFFPLRLPISSIPLYSLSPLFIALAHDEKGVLIGSHLRKVMASGMTAMRFNFSCRPHLIRSLVKLGASWIPAPTSESCSAASRTVTL